jgi:hypothetical protein
VDSAEPSSDREARPRIAAAPKPPARTWKRASNDDAAAALADKLAQEQLEAALR